MTNAFRLPWMRRFSPRSWKIFMGLGMAQLMTIFLGIGSSVLWARYVPKEVYGQYQMVISYTKIISSFCVGGLSESAFLSAAKGCGGNLLKISLYKFMATLGGS